MSEASLDFINSGKCYPSEVLNYVLELEQQKAELINILKSIAKMKENDENELNRITKEIIDTIEKYK